MHTPPKNFKGTMDVFGKTCGEMLLTGARKRIGMLMTTTALGMLMAARAATTLGMLMTATTLGILITATFLSLP